MSEMSGETTRVMPLKSRQALESREDLSPLLHYIFITAVCYKKRITYKGRMQVMEAGELAQGKA